MKKLLLIFCTFLGFLSLCGCSLQKNPEKILNFASHLTVNEDGSVLVREEITINARHKEIRRGIVRVIPTSYEQPVKVLSLQMDGKPHPFFTEQVKDNLEINFGNDDYLKKGVHTYVLEYTMGNAVGFFDGYDEIYWNVTGNDWIFPIDKASFEAVIPREAQAIEKDISIYTGPKGAKGQDAKRLSSDKLEFETTKTINPGEGFTVAVPFTKGFVRQTSILNFVSHLTVNKDASVRAREEITIDVRSENIFGNLARSVQNNAYTDYGYPVEVISFQMDGKPYPFTAEYRKIVFGSNHDNVPEKGIHTFILEYTMKNAVSFYEDEDHDAIWWGITGKWMFPIEKVSCVVILPPGVQTKKFSSNFNDIEGKALANDSNVRFEFETTKTVKPGESSRLDIEIPFDKDLVKNPPDITDQHAKTPGMVRSNIFDDLNTLYPQHIQNIIKHSVIVITLCLLLYYMVTWRVFGRSLQDDIFVTEFAPPPGISPAFIHYLWTLHAGDRAFSSALVNLAMKDKLEIVTKDISKPELHVKDRNTFDFSSEEKYIMRELFKTDDKFTLSASNGAELENYISNVSEQLEENGKPYIKKNEKFLLLPIVVMAVMLLALFFGINPFAFFAIVFYLMLLSSVTRSDSKAVRNIGFVITTCMIFAVLILINLQCPPGMTLWIFLAAAFFISFFGFIAYKKYIAAVTAAGRELMNKIKGFHRYMSVAEEHRVALSNPTDAERIFADYLPYAFAFNMENQWIKEFDGVISAAKIEEYVSRAGGIKFMTNNSLGQAISAAKPSSSGSSSSGSGGGGSSGGGGGGGGGRGR